MSKMTYIEQENYHLAYYKAKQIVANAQKIRDCGLMDAEEEKKEQQALEQMHDLEEQWLAAGGTLEWRARQSYAEMRKAWG